MPALRQWLATYIDFYDRYSGCIDVWVENTTDDPTVSAIGGNGQVLMDVGVAKMLIRQPGPYPFDPIVSAVIVRALVTRVPQAALDLPAPIVGDEVVDLMLSCLRRGFFGMAD